MNAFLIFTKKELLEQWKNKKGISLICVLLVFAFTSPLLAKLLPDILAPMVAESGIAIPPVSFYDSYAQFFKNLEQIVMIMVILLYSGTVNYEVSRNLIGIPLSKGLSKKTVVLAKYSAISLIWLIGYVISCGVFYLYTQLLFPEQAPQYVLLSFLCLLVFFLFLQAVVIFFSAAFDKSYAAMIGSGGVMVALYLLNIFPKTIRYSPLAMSTKPLELIQGNTNGVVFPLVLSLVLIFLMVGAGMWLFQQKEI